MHSSDSKLMRARWGVGKLDLYPFSPRIMSKPRAVVDAEWQWCLQGSPGPDIHSKSTSRFHASPSRLHIVETMGWEAVSG